MSEENKEGYKEIKDFTKVFYNIEAIILNKSSLSDSLTLSERRLNEKEVLEFIEKVKSIKSSPYIKQRLIPISKTQSF